MNQSSIYAQGRHSWMAKRQKHIFKLRLEPNPFSNQVHCIGQLRFALYITIAARSKIKEKDAPLLNNIHFLRNMYLRGNLRFSQI